MKFDPDRVRHTLSAIFREQGKDLPADLLDLAKIESQYVGSDFGRDQYAFTLRIPTRTFAKLESQLDDIATAIQGKLNRLGVDFEDGDLVSVQIFPELLVGPGAIAVPVGTAADERRIWLPGRIRLFLSHVSRVKDAVGDVKEHLLPLGIEGFVAHEDIEPQQPWQREIEIALGSMDALCAFITEDMLTSRWCDQETGFALGRGVPVIAVNYGAMPYGFLGKTQAIGGNNRDPKECAIKIADVIAKQDHLQARFTEALVEAVATAHSYAEAISSMNRLREFQKHLSEAQITRLLQSVRDNSQVREAFKVSDRIEAIAKARKVSLPPEPGTFDDDIPF